MAYSNLFSPIRIGSHTYRNRVVSAPMIFGLITLIPEQRETAFRRIASRAKGGAGAVIVGEVPVNFTDADRVALPPCDFSDYGSEAFHVFRQLAQIIHESGAVAIMELNHPGAQKDPFPGQKNPSGPVSYVKENGVRVEALDREGFDRIAGDYGTAAKYFIRAGFDGILIHGGHGFLFTQFLSPLTNTRTDQYGGSLENRARFPIQILRSVREAIGPDSILELRLSAKEGVDGGLTVEETGAFCHMLEGLVDAIHLSSGLYYSPVATHQFSSMYHPHNVNAADAAVVRQYTTIPVGVVGGINSPDDAEQILASGQADYVILGRQMIADPEFVNKTAAGHPEQIRRCIRCYSCFPGTPEEGYTDLPVSDSGQVMITVGNCSINPASGREPLKPADHPRRVLVVGGGIAGMQAALTASLRGHQVTLAEQADRLGGILTFADTDVDKTDLRNLKNVVISEVMNSAISVELNTKVDGAYIAASGAEYVILATGAHPARPDIPGICEVPFVTEVYHGLQPGRNVVILGGGLAACETALHLSKTGHLVTLMVRSGKLAKDSFGMYKEALMLEMGKQNISVIGNITITEVSGRQVSYTQDSMEKCLDADTVLLAMGMESEDTASLQAACGNTPVTVIGDAVTPGKVGDAMRTAYEAALAI